MFVHTHKKPHVYCYVINRERTIKKEWKRIDFITYYLLVVEIWEIPTRISPSPLMLLCKIAFSRMSPNICDCIKWVVKCQMQCMIAGSSNRSWQWRTLDAVDFVPLLTVTVMFVCAGREKKTNNESISIFDILIFLVLSLSLFIDALMALRCKNLLLY